MNQPFFTKSFQGLTLSLVLSTLLGCGQSPSVDRFEKLNRSTYAFNKGVDRVLLKPVARAYDALIPQPLQTMVGNFFQNLSEVPNMGNDILQGNFNRFQQDFARFLVNSTWGVGGVFDVAGKNGLERQRQDFGLTLAKWGYKDSSYLVLPILGPSTLRDAVGLAVNYEMSIPAHIKSVSARNALLAVNLVDTRASLLKAEPLIGEAVDEYVFIRDAYLQRRAYLITGESSETASNAGATLGEPPE